MTLSSVHLNVICPCSHAAYAFGAQIANILSSKCASSNWCNLCTTRRQAFIVMPQLVLLLSWTGLNLAALAEASAKMHSNKFIPASNVVVQKAEALFHGTSMPKSDTTWTGWAVCWQAFFFGRQRQLCQQQSGLISWICNISCMSIWCHVLVEDSVQHQFTVYHKWLKAARASKFIQGSWDSNVLVWWYVHQPSQWMRL